MKVMIDGEEYIRKKDVANLIYNIEHTGNVTVVYLTTKEKKWLPTRVPVMCKEKSIALCECVNTVSKERLGDYIRSCTKKEMNAIDKALAIQLGF